MSQALDGIRVIDFTHDRSEEHTSELQSQSNLVCRLLLEKKKNKNRTHTDLLEQINNNDQLAQLNHLKILTQPYPYISIHQTTHLTNNKIQHTKLPHVLDC